MPDQPYPAPKQSPQLEVIVQLRLTLPENGKRQLDGAEFQSLLKRLRRAVKKSGWKLENK